MYDINDDNKIKIIFNKSNNVCMYLDNITALITITITIVIIINNDKLKKC
jgi:hypothetical protein